MNADPARADASVETLLADVVDEITQKLNDGLPVEIDAYIDRHPELDIVLPQIFDALALVRQPAVADGEHSVAGDEFQGRLGDFRLIREIGRGGMGVVYEAEQLSLGRRMALKVLPLAATLSVQQLERFKNEARLAASLKHPHIVGVHSVGVERGVHYYAMELIEGCSLAQTVCALNSPQSGSAEVVDSADTSPVAALSTARTNDPQEYFRQIAQLIADAADALEYAHDQGIVHRDIKPGNLLLNHDGKVSVTDFGLARLEADAGVTMTGDLLGTLRYMSPEQAAGKPGMVDYRSDIHALGATLYELLTIRPAFADADRAKLLSCIAEASPPALRQLEPRIPLDLETITAKCLEKEPTDRYQSARELAGDLRAFLDHRQIAAKPPTLPQRVVKWARRNTVAAWGIAACVVLASIMLTWLGTKHAFEQRSLEAALETTLRLTSEALSTNQLQSAQAAIDRAALQAERLRDASHPLIEQIDFLNREVARYGDFLERYREARNSLGRGSIVADAKAALATYRVEEDDDWAKRFRENNLPPSFINQVSEQIYELLIMLAHESIAEFDTHAANLDAVEIAQSYLTRANQLREPTKAYHWMLAACSQCMGDVTEEEVRSNHDREATRLRALAEETLPQTASDLRLIAWDRDGTIAGSAARDPFRWPFESDDEVLAAHREMLRLEPDYYNALFFQALWLSTRGKFEPALEAWNGCLAVDPDDNVALSNRGQTLVELGRADEGLIDMYSAVESIRNWVAADPNRTCLAYPLLSNSIGKVLHENGKSDEAIAAFVEAQAHFLKIAKTSNNYPYLKLGKATQGLLEAGGYEASAPPEVLQPIDAYSAALLWLYEGNYQEAASAFESAILDHPDTSNSYQQCVILAAIGYAASDNREKYENVFRHTDRLADDSRFAANVAKSIRRISEALKQRNRNEAWEDVSDPIRKTVAMSPDPDSQFVHLLRSNLGSIALVHNRCHEAAEQFGVLYQLDNAEPKDVAKLSHYCLALIKKSDQQGYLAYRRKLAAKYSNSAPPQLAKQVLQACLFLPADDELLAKLEGLTQVIANEGNAPDLWGCQSLALYDCRRGNWRQSVKWCEKQLKDPNLKAPSRAITLAILAINHSRLEQSDGVPEILQEIDELIDEGESSGETADWPWTSFVWQKAKHFRAEAVSLHEQGSK